MRSIVLRAALVLAAGIVAAPPRVSAQQLRFGVIGGTNLTRDFHSTFEHYTYDIPELADYWVDVFYYSKSHSAIFGPTMELSLPRGLSLEVDAMRRDLHSSEIVTDPNGTGTYHFTNAKTWEFPVLLKYAVPLPRVRPFFEVGPSFRIWQEPQATEPSNFGITAGLGAEINWRKLRFSPMIRYTHWADETRFPLRPSNPDQVEVLGSITYHTDHASREIAGHKVRIGLIGGPTLTNGLHAGHWSYPTEESRPFTAGLMLELEWNRRWSIEVDGLYHPLHANTLYDMPDGRTARDPFTVLTWQFPVLAKYRLSDSRWAPFVEAGPAPRLSGNRNGYSPSSFGATVGAGLVAAQWGSLRLSPVVRYSRFLKDPSQYWQYDPARTAPNQVDVLVGISF